MTPSLRHIQGGKILLEGSDRPKPGAPHPGPSLVLALEDNLYWFKTAPQPCWGFLSSSQPLKDQGELTFFGEGQLSKPYTWIF